MVALLFSVTNNKFSLKQFKIAQVYNYNYLNLKIIFKI